MAFQSNNAATQQSNDAWKAEAFINLSLALPGQTPVKLPSLALKSDKYGKLIEWLGADPTRVTKLVPYIVADFKSATPSAKVFDFSAIS